MESFPERERVLEAFNPPVASWFARTFAGPTPAQHLGWPAIRAGRSCLILAPTGSGKTLAAFLVAIDRLAFGAIPGKKERCRIVYVSPLKALAVDVERNLRAPLAGIAREADLAGRKIHAPEVAVRTGDTPQRERAAFRRSPADILVTTPESLFLILTSGAREALRPVRTVIVDEVHALAGTKRGVHLTLSLERLEALTGAPLQRIGLSATARPPEEIARFLGGHHDDGAPRPVTIVDAGTRKRLDLTVSVPVEDMARLGAQASIWPAVHPELLERIREHHSTLVFVNSRRLAERLAAALNEFAGEDLVRTHHGSLAREQRTAVENDLKAGRVRALVATSSLELGIDMGAIDLVVHIESPPSVASGLQRIGRAGHHADAPSRGIILPKYRGDLLASAALTERMVEGLVEATRMPRNPLDVLSQQVVAMVAMDDWRVDDLERVVHRAAPYAELSRSMLEHVLDMLSGRYPSDEFAALRPRLTWDRLAGMLRAREGARRVAVTSGGTIPDRGTYGVYLAGAPQGQGRVGELDEEMVFESRAGEVFLLGASSWRIESITHDRVLVSPAPGEPGKMPFWRGDAAGRPLEFGRAIGALARTLTDLPEPEALEMLEVRHRLDDRAARNLLAYLRDQIDSASAVPDDRTIVVERYLDETGDWRVCVLSPFGARVHAPWAMAVATAISEAGREIVDVLWTDDGIVVRFPQADEPPGIDVLLPAPEEVQPLVVRHLGAGGGSAHASGLSPLFASRFREAAGRALLLPKGSPRRRAPLWQQRLRAQELLAAAARFRSFPIVLEVFRECLQDVFDLPSLQQLLADIRSRAVRVVTVDTRVPSPFAAALMFNYVTNFMYEGDAPLAERRAQALTVDPSQLRDLLGGAELRDLLDPAAIDEVERYLQHLAAERAATHADAVHDLLLRVGDLSDDEVRTRVEERADARAWLEQLERERRIARLHVASEPRWIAVEDAGRYRDALGAVLPEGLPSVFLEPVSDPVGDLVARYARTHGPFRTNEAASRLGSGVAVVREALERLARAGRVVEGEFRPGGSGTEWCDANVLRRLRRKSLASLRREAEPVEPQALTRFLLSWQCVTEARRGRSALIETVAQIQGAAIPASMLESHILPARVAGYGPGDLDELTASGQVLWVGAGSLGSGDGRVRLLLAAQASVLHESPAERPRGAIHERIRDVLVRRGASFFPQILGAIGGFPPEALRALWDLVWSGEVTNDTLAPLRALVAPESARRLAERGGAARVVPPEASGRWSLVSASVSADPGAARRLVARVERILHLHGVLTRETIRAESMPGGFGGLYQVLKSMEESGRLRRGYFVAGFGANQFALPEAVERLRALRAAGERPVTVLVAATDPASPYGSTLPWPDGPVNRRPMRVAGALVVLVDGALAAWIARGEHQILTFLDGVPDRSPEEVAREIAAGLAARVDTRKRRVLFVEEVDGRPAQDSALAAALELHGFRRTPRGYLRKAGHGTLA